VIGRYTLLVSVGRGRSPWPASEPPPGIPAVEQPRAPEIDSDGADPSGNLIGHEMLARVHEGDGHGQDVGHEQRPDPPAGPGPEEQQQEHRVCGVQRRHRRYVVVVGAALGEYGGRRTYPEMVPDDRDDPVDGPSGEVVPAGHPRRHRRIQHVPHVADEGEADEQADEAPEPVVATLPEHGGDYIADKEVARVDGPRRVVPHMEMVGIEETPLEPDGRHLAEADQFVEVHLGPGERSPQRMAGIAAQRGVDDQHRVEREPVDQYPATPAAEVVQAGYEKGRGQPDQQRVVGLRKTQGRRGHRERHDQDYPADQRPAPRHYPCPQPALANVPGGTAFLAGARLGRGIAGRARANGIPAGIITGLSADHLRARFHAHQQPACRLIHSRLNRSILSSVLTFQPPTSHLTYQLLNFPRAGSVTTQCRSSWRRPASGGPAHIVKP
jgi:hypothetical protein